MVSMCSVDNEEIIELVKKHPCIYDITCEDNRSRMARSEAWLMIGQTIFSEIWDTLSRAEKLLAGREIQRRWKSLKDAFGRTLRSADNRTDSGAIKKPYVYHKQLTFLIPHLQFRSTAIQDRNSKQNNYIDYTYLSKQECFNETITSDPLALSDEQEPPPHLPPNPKMRRSDFEEERRIESNDPDLMFFYSLIPNMRKLNSSDKMQFQIEVLQCLKKFVKATEDEGFTNEAECPSKFQCGEVISNQKCNMPIKLEVISNQDCNVPIKLEPYFS